MDITRRGFVKGAAIMGAAAATLAGGALQASAEESASVSSASGSASARATSGSASSDASDGSTSELPDTLGKHTWEIKPEPIASNQIKETVDCDIVIIGAGFAGVCAAQSAAEEGAKVTVLEKTDQVQGRGLDIGNIGSTWQQENGYTDYIDKAETLEILSEWGHNKINKNLVKVWIDHSGEAFDHLADYLEKNYDLSPHMSLTANPDHYATDDLNFRELPTCQSFGDGWLDENGNWWMASVVSHIADWATDLGAEFRFDTTAEQLVCDDSGKVTGVIASTSEGYIQVNAAKAVIIATGDIAGNREMDEAWCPVTLNADGVCYTPVGANTGDGITMAAWIGAGFQKGAAAPMIHPLVMKAGPLTAEGTYWLCVNRNGERYFNEYANAPMITNARICQPGGIGYAVFDGGYYDKLLQVNPKNTDVSGAPFVSDSTAQELEDALALNDGTIFKGDTIEELAKSMGADPDTLAATVDRYNELIASGADTDFDKPIDKMTTIDTPPFYASWVPATVLVNIYGLNCDSHSRVCDTDDNPIDGLYAIGNAQGNFFADDYPLICPGLSHGRCMTFGYLLPKAVMKGELL